MYEKRILKQMLRHYPFPRKRLNRPNLKGWDLGKKDVYFLEKNPNAFLFAAIFDRQIKARKAWEAPLKLKDRLGHLDIQVISSMRMKALAKFIGPYKNDISLHRFYNIMSRNIILAAKKLRDNYNGNAKNIWPNNTKADIVLERLLDFDGIGQKIGNMLLIFLVKYYGIKLINLENIDIAVDRNVARVFLRAELISSQRGKRKYKISEIKKSIIMKARELYPKFPGALDEPAYEIGISWCTTEKAYCNINDEGNPCPLNDICKKNKRSYQVT